MNARKMSEAEYYALATTPTSNEMFDNGAWLAPVLSSQDPEIDPRARRAVHFFAEDAPLSVCGTRFGPEHYVETFVSNEETRRRCANCTQVTVAIKAGQVSSKVRVISPLQTVYTTAEFRELIQGTVRIAMRVNRIVSHDGDLYLLIDEGTVPARSLRRDLKRELASVDEVILIWADESALDRLRVDEGLRLADERQREERQIARRVQEEERRAADQRAFQNRQAMKQAALDEQDRLYTEMLAPVITAGPSPALTTNQGENP